MSGGFGAGTSLGIIASQQVKQVCAVEFHGVVRFPLFVNEQRKGNARFLPKSACIDAIPKPHGGQGRSPVPEILFVRAQLRDVLATKDSPVVAQEDNHGRLAEP